ncbi:Protein of unknown function [Gryllus bimaculatus]|nr:Protein of unknown function [Gryllus bimaculatus]
MGKVCHRCGRLHERKSQHHARRQSSQPPSCGSIRHRLAIVACKKRRDITEPRQATRLHKSKPSFELQGSTTKKKAEDSHITLD